MGAHCAICQCVVCKDSYSCFTYVFSQMYWNAILPLCSSVGLETALPRTPSNRKEHDDEAGALQWVSGDRHPVPHLAPARGPLASHLTSLGYSSLLKEKKKSCDSGPQ